MRERLSILYKERSSVLNTNQKLKNMYREPSREKLTSPLSADNVATHAMENMDVMRNILETTVFNHLLDGLLDEGNDGRLASILDRTT